MDPYSNLIMAPETSTLNTASQIKLTEEPIIPIGLERERVADVIKLSGTEEKENKHGNNYK